ncbi:hypothetical protein SODALDRAFT_132559 [Sodiomyces alkalinus F11]|uniref:Zn(2)-C6 fungal-type domain-containing protein n=1 Tax=Sodiomyces alkalinus (strain CBS 110278 / VKM F-3762 / F11) TaxID=1314773 RepID=A0A3N2PYE6_SODAK|nr:hypothetical protein SODALDRAFT_132559 [Sodiomyces alkalinus F11]ROT39561.1 hypothetical protein SODALDRAFT_132559 [Sodiomyces alkalinus F11]
MMPASTTLGRGRKTACEMCRARKRRCDGRLPSCSLCQKAQSRCIYAIPSPYGQDLGVMFHSAPREISCAHPDDSPPEADLSTPGNYDLSRYLAGAMEPRHISPGTPGPISSDSSGFSDMSNNLPDTASLQQHTLGWMQQFSAQLDLPPPEFDSDPSVFGHPSESALSLPDSWQQSLSGPSSAAAAVPSEPSQPQLPSQERVMHMVNSFFSAQHHLLPSVHRESFMARLSNDMASLSSGPFLWVILALYCSCDKSESMQLQYRNWMQTAHSKLELMSTTHVRSNTNNMLQASIWMVFDAYCRGDVTNAWLLLGRTAQLASALGLHRIDSKHRTPRMEVELKSRSDIEVEECRKCMWCLMLLDRVIVSINGLALSVDDRYFHVDFPLPELEFQEARDSIKGIEKLRERYSFEAFDLLNGNVTSQMANKPSFGHVLKVSVILGRALAIQNSIHHGDTCTHDQHLEKLRTLESVLNTFSYAASASGEAVGPTSLMQLWLRMLTQSSKISMLHPPGPSTLGLCNCLSSPSPGVSPNRTDSRCVTAALSAAGAFSQALKETLLALNNPFLLPMACTSVRMLALLRNQMDESDRGHAREVIDEILRVVDHISIKFPGAAAKARETIRRRLNELEHGTREKASTCYVGLDCE